MMKRDDRLTGASDAFARLDRMFDEWARMLPFRTPASVAAPLAEQVISVDEFHEDDTLVVRAEVPGIDPEEDVEVTVADRMLTIRAERREEEEQQERGFVRRELRTGSFARTLSLPDGVSETDITATYRDGILEIRVPMPAQPQPEATRIQVKAG